MSSSHENLFLSENFEMVPNENNDLLALNPSEEKSRNEPEDENNKEDITEFIKNMADQKLNVVNTFSQVLSQNIEGELRLGLCNPGFFYISIFQTPFRKLF